ncbi:MAG: ASKHA domain-containing protein [Candidatus Bathyarchaeia archaeon]
MRITFKPGDAFGFFKEGTTVLEAAKRLGIGIDSICGGKGLCGKCRVKIVSSASPLQLTDAEQRVLTDDEIKAGYRLACALKPISDITVHIPPMSRIGTLKLQTEGIVKPVPLKPAVSKVCVQTPPPSLQDQRSDEERFLQTLKEAILQELGIGWAALKSLPDALRHGGWQATAIIWNGESVVGVEPGDTSKRSYGIAVDIGSTKIALYLIDLCTGNIVAKEAALNPQRAHGEDIMSRLAFANTSEENRVALQTAVIEAVNHLIGKVCRDFGISSGEIYEGVFVGNTAMHHFFLGLDTRYLSLSPYTQVLRSPIDIRPGELGIKINPGGNIHALPTIRSFVGADNVAVCLVTEITRRDKLTLVLDIGTNTEIDCGSKGAGLTVTSAASGPAFEGWATKCGMTAGDGAIERIFIDPDTLEVVYRTIGDKPPVGICGSGYIDAIAEMMKTGIIDQRTAFNRKLESERLRKGPEGYELVIAPKCESRSPHDIVITQRDIGELVKAKAAIHAATELLMRYLGLSEREIDKIMLAGAFGSYINPESARTIGLLPEVELDMITPIGNAAGIGAVAALINVDMRKEAKEVAEKARFVELASHPDFVKEYANSMYLPHKDVDKYPLTASILRR